MSAPRKVNYAGIDKLVADVQAQGDYEARIAAATKAIARLREAVSTLADERQATLVAAKAEGVSYATLARAAGMTTGRMAAIATGRGRYVPKAQRENGAKPAPAAKKAPAKKAAPAKATARKRTARKAAAK